MRSSYQHAAVLAAIWLVSPNVLAQPGQAGATSSPVQPAQPAQPMQPGRVPPPGQGNDSKESSTDEAREYLTEARRLIAAEDYEKARRKLLDAWSRNQGWQIAAYLGLSELKTGHYALAAEHTAMARRTISRQASEGARKSLEDQYVDAKTKVATVFVLGVRPGMKVALDDRNLGVYPLLDPIFLEPGSHTLEIVNSEHPSSGGYRFGMVRAINAQAGATVTVDFRMAPAEAKQDPTPEPAKGLSTRTWIGIGGGALTAIAVGIGVGFSAKASSLNDQFHREAERIGPSDCLVPNGACTTRQTASDRDGAATAANVAYATAAVLGVATVASLFLWPKGPRTESTKAQSVWLSPSTDGRAGMMVMGGRF